MKTTILIADDHYFVRQGLRIYLETIPAIQVVGEASDGLETCNLAFELRPDIIILDLSIPKLDGFDVLNVIRKQLQNIKVIILSMHDQADMVRKAVLDYKVSAYILKESTTQSLDFLVQAIESALNDDILVHPKLTRHLINDTHDKANLEKRVEYSLTGREKEVLRLVAEGLSNKEAAAYLTVSSGTVKTHVSNILTKLNVSSRTEAAIVAVQTGLVKRQLENDIDDN